MIKGSERPGFGFQSNKEALHVQSQAGVASRREVYFQFTERAARLASSRFVWAGVMVSIAGPAALLFLLSQNEAGPVNPTDWPATP